MILTDIGDRNVVGIDESLVGDRHKTTFSSGWVEGQSRTVSPSEHQIKRIRIQLQHKIRQAKKTDPNVKLNPDPDPIPLQIIYN